MNSNTLALPCVNMEAWKEIRKRATQGRKVIGSLGCLMREGTVSKEVKKALRDSVTVPKEAYASEAWMWNKCQRSKIQVIKMSYLRGGGCVNNESVYK